MTDKHKDTPPITISYADLLIRENMHIVEAVIISECLDIACEKGLMDAEDLYDESITFGYKSIVNLYQDISDVNSTHIPKEEVVLFDDSIHEYLSDMHVGTICTIGVMNRTLLYYSNIISGKIECVLLNNNFTTVYNYFSDEKAVTNFCRKFIK